MSGDKFVGFTYSQLGEDRILRHIFPRKYKGFYLDLGAFHPTKYSNTALLYERGWHGINVDANKNSIELFKHGRPQDINLNIAISDMCGEVEFYPSHEKISPYGTIIPDMAQHKKTSAITKVKVNALTINDVVKNYVPDKQIVDLLNVDLEGMDETIIASIDFSLFRPKVICVEIHNFSIEHVNSNLTFTKLRENGYRLMSFCVVSAIFVDNKIDFLAA
jgi:FkbM family methyltransferase